MSIYYLLRMDLLRMETKCEHHENKINAFCRKHRVTLCIYCVLKDSHKIEEEECDVCTLEEIDNEDEKSYIELLGIDRLLKERIKLLESEGENIDDIGQGLERQVENRFEEIVKLIQAQKDNTLDELRKEIEIEKSVFQTKVDKIHSYRSHVTKLLRNLDTIIEGDNNDYDHARDTQISIRKLKSDLLDSVNIEGSVLKTTEKTLEARFVATPPEGLELSMAASTLGHFKFEDGLYEDVNTNSPIPESIKRNDDSAQANIAYKETTGASNTDLRSKCEQESDEIQQSISNPLYGISENRQSLEEDSNQRLGSVSTVAEIKGKEIHVICSEASSKSPCVICKLENVADKGYIILDSAHNSVVLVDNSGDLLDSVRDKIKYRVVIDMCLFKKNRLTLFYDYDGFLQIATLEVCRKSFKHCKTINVSNAISIEELPCTGFESDPKSHTLFISFPDRIITIEKDRNGLLRREKSTLRNLSGIVTRFDPHDKSFYTMDKTLKTIECYSFEKGAIMWTVSQSRLPSHDFVPVALRQSSSETLALISSRQLFVITKKNGFACPTAITLKSDATAFCLKGKGIVIAETITEEYRDKPSVVSVKLIEYF